MANNKPISKIERQKGHFSWLEIAAILLVIILGIVGMHLYGQGIEPDSMVKQAFKTTALNALSQNQQKLDSPTAESSIAGNQLVKSVDEYTKIAGVWVFNLKKITWKNNTVYVLITIKNSGNKALSCGLEDESWDWWAIPTYKIYAVDSNQHIFRETSAKITGAAFYCKIYNPGEEASGSLRFTVNPNSEDIYLYMYNGSSPKYQLFFLGDPK